MNQYRLVHDYVQARLGGITARVVDDERGAVTAEHIVTIGAAVVGAAVVGDDHLAEDARRRQQHPDPGAVTEPAATAQTGGGGDASRDDERGMAATIVLFPLFASAVFLLVNGIWWQNDRQAASVAADRASQAVALYGYPVGDAEAVAVAQARSGGLRDVSVSISRGADATVAVVSGEAPGLLPGMSVSVTARSVTPTEEWQP